MKKQLLSKAFWRRFLLQFPFYFLLWLLISYAMRDKAEDFWQAHKLVGVFGVAFFICFNTALRNEAATEEEEDSTKPSVGEFFGMFLLLLVVMLLAAAVLVPLVVLILSAFTTITGDPWEAVWKGTLVISVMTFSVHAVAYTQRVRRYRRLRKGA